MKKKYLLNIVFIVFLILISTTFSDIWAVTKSNDEIKEIPRPEHPKPQFKRDNWLNLNGEWDFAFDFSQSGDDKGWSNKPSALDKKILVPFCPESKLSGIGFTDFIPAVWYHRKFSIPKEWDGYRIFLHFGAVDYDCRAWVNGIPVGRHYGGGVSFSFEITNAMQTGENSIVVCAKDDTRSGLQPAGKQSDQSYSYTIMYTRTTGIWQTVWLEARLSSFIESVRVVPDLDKSCFVLTPVFNNYKKDLVFKATLISDDDKEISTLKSSSSSGIPLKIKVPEPKSWSPEHPYLYRLKYELIDNNRVVDEVESYAGLRKFHVEGNKFYLNNKPVFLRFVLDQGFNPEGIWTAPDDNALKADIERAKAVGFNGARLHQKVFEERFHYWADKLGYLTWGEFYDWGLNLENHQAMQNMKREWSEILVRDRNHPSIISWAPLNERRSIKPELYRRFVQEIVALTHVLDPTRPVNDASGWVHVDTDVFSVHDYEQDPEIFFERYDSLSADNNIAFIKFPEVSAPYEGQPYVVDEYGGTSWSVNYEKANYPSSMLPWEWGYGKSAQMMEKHIEELTNVLLNNPGISGFCYTQLTDVEYEINGIYTYKRKLKFNAERLKKIFGAPAAVEKIK